MIASLPRQIRVPQKAPLLWLKEQPQERGLEKAVQKVKGWARSLPWRLACALQTWLAAQLVFEAEKETAKASLAAAQQGTGGKQGKQHHIYGDTKMSEWSSEFGKGDPHPGSSPFRTRFIDRWCPIQRASGCGRPGLAYWGLLYRLFRLRLRAALVNLSG
jgi:hypothetical protein